MRRRSPSLRSASARGFTLVEMIVVVFLLALAMLGILSVFDASARINKSEQDVADAQGAVRYGIYSMTRAIRMAGSGGLYVTQAVLNAADQQLPGISPRDLNYDNVPDGATVQPMTGDPIPIRPGTDMIEVRGVINSPLIGFDLSTGCEPCNPESAPSGGCSPCVGVTNLDARATTNMLHVNDDSAKRPQFSQIDAYTAGVTAQNPMLVLVAFNDDLHPACTLSNGSQVYPLYPQPPYNVGAITNKTRLVSGGTFGSVNFLDTHAIEFNPETPAESGSAAGAEKNIRHAGILDDLIFFIDNSNPIHPALAQGTRRGDAFDVVALADDVEDMQIAYGVDANGDNAITIKPGATQGADSNVSSDVDGDEWAPNVTGETPYAATAFFDPAGHCPRLHAVMISLVAKSHDPDPTYRAINARGLLTMNSPVTIAPPHPDTAQYPGLSPITFRRRVQTLKINLRNYAYEGG